MLAILPRFSLSSLGSSISKSKKILIPVVIGGITALATGCGLTVSLGAAASSGMFGYYYSLKTRAVSTIPPSSDLKTQNVAVQLGIPISRIDEQAELLIKPALDRFSQLLFLNSPEAVLLLKECPDLRPLKEVVDICLNDRVKDLIYPIHVLLGIKPVFAIEEPNDYSEDSLEKLKKMMSLNANCRIVEPTDSSKVLYFVNERPLPNYDPWIYLNPVISKFFDGAISKAIQTCFPIALHENYFSMSDLIMPLQTCSYMFGFGPTWEAYMQHRFYLNQLKTLENLDSKCALSPQHYDQLSQAVQTKEELERLYSANLWKAPKITILERDTKYSKSHKMMEYLNLHFVFDQTSLKTPYLKNLIVDASKVMDFLCSYHPEYKSKKPAGLDEWVLMAAYGHPEI